MPSSTKFIQIHMIFFAQKLVMLQMACTLKFHPPESGIKIKFGMSDHN